MLIYLPTSPRAQADTDSRLYSDVSSSKYSINFHEFIIRIDSGPLEGFSIVRWFTVYSLGLQHEHLRMPSSVRIVKLLVPWEDADTDAGAETELWAYICRTVETQQSHSTC